MHRRARGLLPLADPLEPKLLLSLAAPHWLGRAAPSSTAPVFAHDILPVNSLGGAYEGLGNLRLTDVPLDAAINATGWVKGLGHTRLYGSLSLGGYRPIGESYLTLSNGRGTITVQLNDAQVTQPVPASTFHVTAFAETGTGAYKDVHRVETATVSFGPDTLHDESNSFLKAIGGTITIKLDDPPPQGGRPPETSRPSAHPVRIPATVSGGSVGIIRKVLGPTTAADSVASMAWSRPTYIHNGASANPGSLTIRE